MPASSTILVMDAKEFENLSQAEQEKIFHQTPFKEKWELLLHSHNPVSLAQSLSQEELYLVTWEMDLEERSEILRYASLPQLFFISDVDCWKRDRIDPDKFLTWLEILLKADEKRLLAWLLEMDYETVVAGLKKLVWVAKPDREYATDEILGDIPYFTLDESYFIYVREENIETVRRTFEILFENHRGKYFSLLEGIMAELDDELEEEAFLRRGIRLGERGFPDFETAYKIYRPLTREEFEKSPSKSLQKGSPLERLNLPDYPVLWSAERFFLDEVLLFFRNDTTGVREKLQEELAWLSNKVLASNGIDFSSEERVRQGVERARFLINLGLEDLSGGDLNAAQKIITEKWLENIFRWGATQILDLREEAHAIVRKYWSGSEVSFLQFLNPPYEFVFQGLMRPLPLFYDPLIKTNDSFRDFKTPIDVERVRRAIQQLEKLHSRLLEIQPGLFSQLAAGDGEISVFSLLGTMFARFVLDKSLQFKALSESELQDFSKQAFESKGKSAKLKTDLKEKFLQAAFLSQQELLKPLWSLMFDHLEEELGHIPKGGKLDRRYISAVRIK